MKSKKSIFVILAALLVLTAVLAVIHINTRDYVPEGSIMVSQNNAARYEAGAGEIGSAYLILSDDDTARLIVFGDSNSKRDVKNVVKIEFK